MYLIHNEMKEAVMKSVTAYNKIKQQLMSGKWDFGERISIPELIDTLGISRRPIMDAMKMLEGEGFIEIVPQSGCKVIDFSKKDMIDQLILSSALEALCAELAAENHTPKEIEAAIKYNDEIKQSPERLTDKFQYFNYNREIHYHIASMTHSQRIIKETMRMWDLNDFYLLNLFEKIHFDFSEPISFHERVLNAIKDKDAQRAAKIMKEHMLEYVNKVERHLPDASAGLSD